MKTHVALPDDVTHKSHNPHPSSGIRPALTLSTVAPAPLRDAGSLHPRVELLVQLAYSFTCDYTFAAPPRTATSTPYSVCPTATPE